MDPESGALISISIVGGRYVRPRLPGVGGKAAILVEPAERLEVARSGHSVIREIPFQHEVLSGFPLDWQTRFS